MGKALELSDLIAESETVVNRPNGSNLSMALTGDTVLTRRLSLPNDDASGAVWDHLRAADVAFTNLETLFHDFEPYPMHEAGGTYVQADPALAHDLRWSGISLASLANNHAGDYGPEGIRLTLEHAKSGGLIVAGAGESAIEAREPKFIDTSHGRVALVAVTSTYPAHSRATIPRDGVRGRPGVSCLRYRLWHELRRQALDDLVATMTTIDIDVSRRGDAVQIGPFHFAIGTTPTRRTEPDAADLEVISREVRNASRLADHTIVSFHSHESQGGITNPDDFAIEFAHAMIDAGASVVAGHGAHILRGVEVYRGRPILYSLGNFIFQLDSVSKLPNDCYEQSDLGPEASVGDYWDKRYDSGRKGLGAIRRAWESVIAEVHWRGPALVSVTFIPIDLGFRESIGTRGRPRVADLPLATKIIGDLRTVSQPFGTRIQLVEGAGHLELS